ncbi:hypothetical protein MAPG_05507 [Magnaporthiopsis poae ATCC 64411]|uniref:Uncharacterized protein n=1 Tax=Magnaporthiopsis poae (strain ATCC 64411 / 73-15) TaxID=644358 RepID=A0A0C4DZK4_MAGP6|nr:hypothetical protein MAPG_05507 [Magnaporthiopsis poae ATCC 64411]
MKQHEPGGRLEDAHGCLVPMVWTAHDVPPSSRKTQPVEGLHCGWQNGKRGPARPELTCFLQLSGLSSPPAPTTCSRLPLAAALGALGGTMHTVIDFNQNNIDLTDQRRGRLGNGPRRGRAPSPRSTAATRTRAPAAAPGKRESHRSVMSSDSLHSRTASNGSLADDDSMPDAGQPSCPSSPASMDEPRFGPRLAASRTAGMRSLISRLNSQNLLPGTEDDHPDSSSAPAPPSPPDVSMPDLDGQEETAQQAAAREPTPESISDLQGLSRDQHLRLMRRSGPADRSRVLSLLEEMVAKSHQCNVRRPPLSRTAAPRPTATTIAPSTDTATASISATKTPTPTASADDRAAAAPTSASSAPPPPPPPPRPQLLPGGDGEIIEADSGEEDGEESWQRWQKNRETAALLRAAKTPAGIRKNGLARMYYTSQEVALRCPNVIMSKPRMRMRRKSGDEPAKTSGRGGAPRASAALSTPSAAVTSAPSASNIAPDPHTSTA